MNFANQNPYQASRFGATDTAAYAAESERTAFIRRTYLHLFGAILAFMAIEALLVTTVPRAMIMRMVTGYGWLIVLGLYMGASYVARMWASSDTSRGMQYLGLGAYVAVKAVIFLPLIYFASLPQFGGGEVIGAAGVITMILFGGMTAIMFFTKADMSWMGKYLAFAGIAALGLIVCGVLFGFELGMFFSFAMVALMCGYIMYDTSNVIHHYRPTQHVAASLALFASVATLFYYVLHIMMQFSSSD